MVRATWIQKPRSKLSDGFLKAYMNEIGSIKGYNIIQIDKNFARAHAAEILNVLKEIQPFYLTEKDILAEEKGSAKYNNKWTHSVGVMDGKTLIGVLIAYDRDPGGIYYFAPSLYIHHFAVTKKYQKQGIGSALLRHVINKNHLI